MARTDESTTLEIVVLEKFKSGIFEELNTKMTNFYQLTLADLRDGNKRLNSNELDLCKNQMKSNLHNKIQM